MRSAIPGHRPFRAGSVCAALMAATCLIAATDGAAAARTAADTPPDGRRDVDAPTPSWREGPVRYLLVHDEDNAYRALTSDEERRQFIRRFWAERDPDPATPVNEYRELFYRRVADADRLFNEAATSGWKTDRGKIYILLGPPDEIDRSAALAQPRDVIEWTYRQPPAGSGINTQVSIRFVRDLTGEFRLVGGLGRAIPIGTPGFAFQVQALQMRSIPEPHRVLDAASGARTLGTAGALTVRYDFYQSFGGRTLVVLTAGLRDDLLELETVQDDPAAAVAAELVAAGRATTDPGDEGDSDGHRAGIDDPQAGDPAGDRPGPRFSVMVRLAGETSDLGSHDLAGTDRLRPGAVEIDRGTRTRVLLFQGGVALRPGKYTLTWVITDADTDRVVAFEDGLEVPGFPESELALSSVTLASRLETVAGESPAGYEAPFRLGNQRVLPRPGDGFHNGEKLSIYYQVYGTATDPIDGRPDIDVEYRFFVANESDPQGNPIFAPLGQPIRLTRQQSPVQKYSLPLTDWGRATYRLRVQVTDNLNGRMTSREVTFRVL